MGQAWGVAEWTAALSFGGAILGLLAKAVADITGMRRDIQHAIAFSQGEATKNDAEHREFRTELTDHKTRIAVIENKAGIHVPRPA